ncbi:bifunctional UDP-3-O-[3-hydroxymyristoyl] N-acetylglucosamine deacetylase/3-hydroxyacyl-ACP dehydratase [Chitinivibrio alkaliphilus]|uniref:Multifunctional fusion protein n=1 Tax=Chitinivibrio alkaliphilus ACht1 TaxID=1313304 RepID=U7D5G1_9BACT|nr:bifunctional UDP-3-O-[3-hydroxymyristoyl] N-acetylglucosamine deacetylase/3-hydroxyacyl-ACP dehydratase [Chitinivibrio alkaliphilus]ERP31759.1 bifunctional UDP-3-O-[3-hydroxymyristoyl] N-acetylglucosamine deacetylase/(3R)-hydroxymyristoyl-ACP dehydratase [Chitinivibrio alkaliphilus ACht1]
MKQKTVQKTGSLSGIGLHTGAESTVTLVPAPEDYGIRFVRVDLPDKTEIPADINFIVGNARGTAIGIGSAVVHTIEHLMATLAAFGISNLRVEVNAEEIPLMDGSAQPFFSLVKELGVCEQEKEQEYIVISEPMWLYSNGNTALSVFPADQFHLSLMMDFDNPAIGAQHTTIFNLEDFETDFAPARTFCFLSEIEHLREKGLIKGASINSAVVVQDKSFSTEDAHRLEQLMQQDETIRPGTNGFVNNTELRFENELCRHKALDLVGDLYLLGKPLKGHILGARSGHAANHELAKKIREHFNKKEQNMSKIEYKDILQLLPHRYPFLLVDGVDEITPGESIVAYKNVSFNEQFFQGHFPDNPIMPGVLQIEALAQAAGLMALYGDDADTGNAQMLFLGVDKVKWRNPVRPGDKLVLKVSKEKMARNILSAKGKAYIGDKIACQAELRCMITKE